MKIPDETHYRPGERHIEDIKGYVLCTQCDKCPLNSETTIRPEGAWRCFYFDKWKKGDDLVEYKCPGYQIKSCHTCDRKDYCKDAGTILYCRSYNHVGMHYKIREYYGRRQAIQTDDPVVLQREHNYIINQYRRLHDELY